MLLLLRWLRKTPGLLFPFWDKMYTFEFPGGELFSESFDEVSFVRLPPQTITMEHSLISLAKWEGRHHKAFLKEGANLTTEEQLDYFYCMCITKDVNPLVFACAGDKEIRKLNDYISDPMTAVKFRSTPENGRGTRDVVTADLIYYWMVSLNIPFECEKWHLNRLLALIRVCNMKNAPPKNMSKREILRNNHALNQARRARTGSKG